MAYLFNGKKAGVFSIRHQKSDKIMAVECRLVGNSPTVVYSSCSQAYLYNEKKEGYYPIRHYNMDKVASVKCKLIDNEATAVFHHDSEINITVDGFENPGSYRCPKDFYDKASKQFLLQYLFLQVFRCRFNVGFSLVVLIFKRPNLRTWTSPSITLFMP